MAKRKSKQPRKKSINRRNSARKSASRLTQIEIRDVRNLILISLIAIVGIFAFQKVSEVPINTIVINSQLNHVDKQQIRKIVTKYYQQGFFTIRLVNFEKELEIIPWVYQANIKRQWPNKLIIEIAEQTPVFRWSGQELLNTRAEKFFVDDNSQFTSLPKLAGTKGRERFLAEMFVQYNDEFKELNMSIVSIEEDARYEKQMQLSNGILINVGKEKVAEKIQRLLSSFAEFEQEELTAITSIDLRHSNGFSVRWNG